VVLKIVENIIKHLIPVLLIIVWTAKIFNTSLKTGELNFIRIKQAGNNSESCTVN